MIRFFKTLQPATLVLIPVIILIFWIRIVSHSQPVVDGNEMLVWKFVSSFLGVFPSWFNFILLFTLISFEAIYLNLILNKYEVLYKNSFVPALMFAIIISCSPSIMQFHPVHLVNLFMILIIDKIFSVYKNENSVSGLIDSGLLAGVASLTFFPAVILLPLLLTTLTILRPFRIKEWLVILVGFFLPWFFAMVYMFWNHLLHGFIESYLDLFRKIQVQFDITTSPSFYALIAFIGLLLLLSLFKLRLNFRKNVIRTRSYQLIFILYFIFGTGCLVLLKTISTIHFTFLILPISVFISYLFLSARRKLLLYEYAFWALVGVIAWNHFVN